MNRLAIGAFASDESIKCSTKRRPCSRLKPLDVESASDRVSGPRVAHQTGRKRIRLWSESFWKRQRGIAKQTRGPGMHGRWVCGPFVVDARNATSRAARTQWGESPMQRKALPLQTNLNGASQACVHGEAVAEGQSVGQRGACSFASIFSVRVDFCGIQREAWPGASRALLQKAGSESLNRCHVKERKIGQWQRVKQAGLMDLRSGHPSIKVLSGYYPCCYSGARGLYQIAYPTALLLRY
jgi:hypothetical protein